MKRIPMHRNFYPGINLSAIFRKLIILLLLLQGLSFISQGQMRQVFYDPTDEDNHLNKLSFYTPSDGYVAFTRFIGHTTDSGKTFTRKYITRSNVNLNNYPNVNLTFGFDISGVKALNKDTIILYGNYGFVPAIIYGTNEGNSLKLVYHSQVNNKELTIGITDLNFSKNNKTGYAVEADRIIKTTTGGRTWFPVYIGVNSFFDFVQVLDDNTVFAYNTRYNSKILKTTNGGASWEQISFPETTVSSLYFITDLKGWLSTNEGKILYTEDGGLTWESKNNEMTPFEAIKMQFINDSTGYAFPWGYTVYKTTDSGKFWEPLPRVNNFSYLNYTFRDIQVFNENMLWAGGGHGHLEMSGNGGGESLPEAYFIIDTSNLSKTKTIQLTNYSKQGYQYQWFRNNSQIGNTYHASYTQDIKSPTDTIKLVVIKGNSRDTSMHIQHFNLPPDNSPFITSFSPDSAIKSSTVTITGLNFTGATTVHFGSREAASFTIVSNSEIKAIVGDGESGNVSVTTPHGKDIKSGFVYLAPPRISSFTPNSGDAGTVISISGVNLNTVTGVSFGGVPAGSFTIISPTSISAVVASGASGNVKLISSFGNDSASGFVFTPKNPVITSVIPTSAAVNSIITINGKNFNSDPAKNVVYFGSIKAVITAASENSLTVKVPAGASTNYLTVTTNKLTAYSNKQFAVTFEGGTDINDSSFTKSSFVIGTQHAFLTTADLDNDGKIDFYTSKNTISNIEIFKNTTENGVLSFSPSFDQRFGNYPRGMTYGDIDGDGMNDIAVVNYFDNTVSIAKNLSQPGSFSFAPPRNFETRKKPWMPTIHDMDGDGKPDALIGIEGNAIDFTFQFSVLRNTTLNDSISFSPHQDFAAGSVPLRIYVEDIDGDGKPDIISANANEYPISIFRNTSTVGKISFSPGIHMGKNNMTNRIAIGDMDGDGKTDITLISINRDQFRVLRNTSVPGTISFMSSENFPIGNSNSTFYTTDLNGDGRPDIIFNDHVTRRLSVIQNNSTPGNITLGQKVTFKDIVTPGSVGLDDFNGDGKVDIAYLDSDTRSLIILKNQIGSNQKITVCLPASQITINSNITGNTYQWQQDSGNGFSNINNGNNISGTKTAALQLKNIVSTQHGLLFRCLVDGKYSKVFELDIKDGLRPSVSINVTDTAVCKGSSVNFTAVAVQGGSMPAFEWMVDDKLVGSNSDKLVFGPVEKDILVKVKLTSNAECISQDTVTSNIIPIKIKPFVTPTVKISASETVICNGATVTFTATYTNEGSKPQFQWQKNGLPVGSNQHSYTDNALTDKDSISLRLISNDCVSETTVTSNTIVLTVKPVIKNSVQIEASTTNICAGQPVIFNAKTAIPVAENAYTWLINGVATSGNSAVLNTDKLFGNDEIRAVVLNTQSCGNQTYDTSNAIKVTVRSSIIPTIKIEGNNVIGQGQSVTLKAIVTHGGQSPQYQWEDSTNLRTWTAIATTPTLVYRAAATGDKIRCKLVSNESCVSGDTVVSSPITFKINILPSLQPVPPAVPVQLHPNPVSNMLIIDSLKLTDYWHTLEITDLNGNRVLNQNILYQTKLTIYIGHLNKGMYVATLKKRIGKPTHLRFIKL